MALALQVFWYSKRHERGFTFFEGSLLYIYARRLIFVLGIDARAVFRDNKILIVCVRKATRCAAV